MRRSTTKRLTYTAFAVLAFFLLWRIMGSSPETTTSLSDLKKPAPKAEPKQIIEEKKAETEPLETAYDPAAEVAAQIDSVPVVIYSKSYCPYSKKAKFILQNLYALFPEPLIVELDLHEHGAEIQEYLKQKTGRGTVPNVFVGGESRGGGDDLEELHQYDALVKSFGIWTDNTLHIAPDAVQIAAYNDLRAQ